MKTKLISINVDGLEVIGKITRHEKYYLEVEILHPYVNWKNYRSISPVILRNSPNPFINSWEEMSEEILLNSYKKLKSIDKNIDSVVKEYENLNEEINAVTTLFIYIHKFQIKHISPNDLNILLCAEFILVSFLFFQTLLLIYLLC